MLAFVDSDMYDEVSSRPWTVGEHNYPYSSKNGRAMNMGRFVLEPRHGFQVDHINGNPLDNRRCNLREATLKQNQQNQGKRLKHSATSRYKGVYWSKCHQAWRAQIRVDGRKFHLGTFKTDSQAAMCYNDAAYRNFGDFARLNVIEQEPIVVAIERKVTN